MANIYNEAELDKLEQEEHSFTIEMILAMFVLLGITKRDIKKEVMHFYQQYGKDGVVTYKEARKWIGNGDHRKRLNALNLSVAALFTILLDKLTPKFTDLIGGVLSKEKIFFDADIGIEDLLYSKWGVDNLHWLNRLEKDLSIWQYSITSDLKQGILRQDNMDDVLDQIEGRFSTMQNVLNRLALTESTALGSVARREIFKDLGIDRYKFYAREDERTCEHCGSLHGLIFPVSAYEIGVSASPIHAFCRCWEIPITD